jgi:hypothetical protein
MGREAIDRHAAGAFAGTGQEPVLPPEFVLRPDTGPVRADRGSPHILLTSAAAARLGAADGVSIRLRVHGQRPVELSGRVTIAGEEAGGRSTIRLAPELFAGLVADCLAGLPDLPVEAMRAPVTRID